MFLNEQNQKKIQQADNVINYNQPFETPSTGIQSLNPKKKAV